MVKPKVDRSTAKQIEVLDNFKKGSITVDEAILELRGGDYNWVELVTFFLGIWMWLYSAPVDAFQPDPFNYLNIPNWFNGKDDYENAKYNCNALYRQGRSVPQSRFDPETLHLMKKPVEADNFIMDRTSAYNLVKETYSESMQITDNCRISFWQGAKKIYHGMGVGVNPEDYGMTQAELLLIGKKGGLISYVQKGHKLPSIEHVKAYQEALQAICLNPTTVKFDDSKYYTRDGVTPATVFLNEESQSIIAFNQTTGDLITGDRQREGSVDKFKTTNTLGAKEWVEVEIDIY